MSARNVAGEVILRRLATSDHSKIPAVRMIEKCVAQGKLISN
jgi:hypothetical protein